MKTVALIVTFNRLEKLKLCWAVTARQSFDHIVIVNNASSDGTTEWLAHLSDPRLHLLQLNENTGGAGGFKQGSRYIAENISADWVFIYDDDAWPQDNIVEFFSQLKQIEDYAAFACKVVNTKGELCKMNLPWKKIPASLKENISYGKNSSGYVVNADRCEDAITFSFVGVIIRQKTLTDNIGYLFEDLFIYFDDVYFSAWLSASGQRIQYTPDITFVHDVPVNSSSTIAAWKVYYLVRNMLQDKTLLGINAMFSPSFKIVRLAKYAMLGFKQPRKLHYFYHFLKGVTDGFSGRSGRRH